MIATNLNGEEKRLVKALRKFRAAERKGPRPVPAALMEHGYVSKVKAAQLLGVELEVIEKLATSWSRYTYGLDEAIAVYPAGIPLSELRYAWEAIERTRIRKTAEEIAKAIKTKYVSSWVAHQPGQLSPAFREDLFAYSVEDVAAELRLTMKDALALMLAPEGLACYGKNRNSLRCSRYELEAMKRSRSIPGSVGYPAQSRRVWANVEKIHSVAAKIRRVDRKQMRAVSDDVHAKLDAKHKAAAA
ncbi:MAG: hypothetical protein QM723_05285 [Myxococcaceae bacterium]